MSEGWFSLCPLRKNGRSYLRINQNKLVETDLSLILNQNEHLAASWAILLMFEQNKILRNQRMETETLQKWLTE